MDLTKICRFIAYFLMLLPPRYTFLKNELELNDKPIGATNKIIELDKAKIGKRKYNTERIRNSKKLFILPIPNRSDEIILPIIRKYVAPDSIIHIDKLRAYNALSNENYVH
ncbi:hypothetical protein ACFW04_013661 [Cataglyphis niger]